MYYEITNSFSWCNNLWEIYSFRSITLKFCKLSIDSYLILLKFTAEIQVTIHVWLAFKKSLCYPIFKAVIYRRKYNFKLLGKSSRKESQDALFIKSWLNQLKVNLILDGINGELFQHPEIGRLPSKCHEGDIEVVRQPPGTPHCRIIRTDHHREIIGDQVCSRVVP